MSHAMEVRDTPDEMIRILATRENGIVHYGIGEKITVTWRGGDRYLCHTCSGNDRWSSADHKGCAHIQRIIKYREEHPDTPAGSGT